MCGSRHTETATELLKYNVIPDMVLDYSLASVNYRSSNDTEIKFEAICNITYVEPEFYVTQHNKIGLPLENFTDIILSECVKVFNNKYRVIGINPTVTYIGTTGRSFSIQIPLTVSKKFTKINWANLNTLPSILENNVIDRIESKPNPNIVTSSGYYPFNSLVSIFETTENGNNTAMRNSNNWCSGYDFSCVSTWSESYDKRWKFTAITPRHVISANHVGGPIPIGKKIMFCRNNGTIVTRTVTRSVRILDSDILITTLNDTLPITINICSIFDTDWKSKLIPSIADGYNFPIPTVFVSQDDYICTLKWYKDMGWINYTSSDDIFTQYSMSIRSGDSGNPIFALAPDDNLILISIFSSTTGGPNIGDILYRNALETEVGLTGHSLKILNLSAYNVT